jgi:hypothetical protein
MKKFSKSWLIVSTLVSSTLLVACGSGNNSTLGSTPGANNGSNGNPNNAIAPAGKFSIYMTDGSTQHIRLLPLQPQQLANSMRIAATRTPQLPQPSYQTSPGLFGFPANFYGNNKLPTLNQLDFGTCVTFSSSAALSYLYSGYTTTTQVSPVNILDASYAQTNQSVALSGWDGLENAGVLLDRLPSMGYFQDYYATQPTYSQLSNEYDLLGVSGDLTKAQLTGLKDFIPQYMAYLNSSNRFESGFTNLNPNLLFAQPGANNASQVIQALDAGKIVLLDFNVYDASVAANSQQCQNAAQLSTVGTYAYKYNSLSGNIEQQASAQSSNNTWVIPNGCPVGGHQVWVVGYAKASNGQTLFVIRNSWGDSGDDGQYYMTDDYLIGAATYAVTVSR